MVNNRIKGFYQELEQHVTQGTAAESTPKLQPGQSDSTFLVFSKAIDVIVARTIVDSDTTEQSEVVMLEILDFLITLTGKPIAAWLAMKTAERQSCPVALENMTKQVLRAACHSMAKKMQALGK